MPCIARCHAFNGSWSGQAGQSEISGNLGPELAGAAWSAVADFLDILVGWSGQSTV